MMTRWKNDGVKTERRAKSRAWNAEALTAVPVIILLQNYDEAILKGSNQVWFLDLVLDLYRVLERLVLTCTPATSSRASHLWRSGKHQHGPLIRISWSPLSQPFSEIESGETEMDKNITLTPYIIVCSAVFRYACKSSSHHTDLQPERKRWVVIRAVTPYCHFLFCDTPQFSLKC